MTEVNDIGTWFKYVHNYLSSIRLFCTTRL